MGLRINTDTGILTTIRNVQDAFDTQQESIGQISSGDRLFRSSRDPSALTLSQVLRADLEGINRAVQNSQRAGNVLRTADSGLREIGEQLSSIRSAALEAQNGTIGNDQLSAIQDSVNSSIQAIDRIANTTRFGDTNLLNGLSGFQIGDQADELRNVRVDQISPNTTFPANIDVTVTQDAARAEATGTIDDPQSGSAEVRISGERGSAVINIADGASRADVEEAINNVSDQTGVEAENGTIQSTRVGSEAKVKIEELEGDLDGISEGTNFGQDVAGTINGVEANGRRLTLEASGNQFRGEVTLEESASAGTFSFEVEGGGLQFQLGTDAVSTDQLRIGISSALSNAIGDIGGEGSLASLRSGGENSIVNDPSGAITVVDEAINQISGQRGRLGAVESDILQTNQDALEQRFSELSEAESEIRDANIASVLTENIRASLISEAGLSVLRNAQFNQGNILDVLGGA